MQIRTHVQRKLRRMSKPIEKTTLDVKKLAKKMERFVESDGNCLGLAAPQIGKNIRLVVVKLRLRGEDNVERVVVETLVNPRIVATGGEHRTEDECCLSCPGYQVAVSRPLRAVVTYEDLKGNEYSLLLVGWQSRIVQHEIDHLDGILIIDKEQTDEQRNSS